MSNEKLPVFRVSGSGITHRTELLRMWSDTTLPVFQLAAELLGVHSFIGSYFIAKIIPSQSISHRSKFNKTPS